jgi:fused signal recognition particle receptor
MGLIDRLREGLSKTRNSVFARIDSMLSAFTKIDDDLFDELEEILIMADVGIGTTEVIMENLKKTVRNEGIKDPLQIKELLKAQLVQILESDDNSLNIENTPAVIVVLGVNGVGKTTTIGKIASMLKNEGKKVLLAAGDTFRAAAIEQLDVWAKRVGVDIIANKEGADPASVVYDALQAAKSRKMDVVICDTAGRLHTKKNLMEELKKIMRIIRRELPESSNETLLVLDATTGQNAVMQAETFNVAIGVSGLVLTKLDGTAKGGVVASIRSRFNIPIKFIGVGENIDDLQPFNAKNFVDALFM